MGATDAIIQPDNLGAMGSGGPASLPLLPPAPKQEEVSDEQKKSLRDVHKNLVKVQAFGLQILETKTENPVLVDLVEKLTSTLEESENCCLILSKAKTISQPLWPTLFWECQPKVQTT